MKEKFELTRTECGIFLMGMESIQHNNNYKIKFSHYNQGNDLRKFLESLKEGDKIIIKKVHLRGE